MQYYMYILPKFMSKKKKKINTYPAQFKLISLQPHQNYANESDIHSPNHENHFHKNIPNGIKKKNYQR